MNKRDKLVPLDSKSYPLVLDELANVIAESFQELYLTMDRLTDEIRDLCSLLREQREWKYVGASS